MKLLSRFIVISLFIFSFSSNAQNRVPSPSEKIHFRNIFFGINQDKMAIPASESVESLLQLNQLIKNPKEMESLNLMQGRAKQAPWSDDYWPIYSGILGKRYDDPMFAYKDNWYENHQYILDVSAESVLKSNDPKLINQLSPSEKYDILVGDNNYTLTKKMWSEGKYYWDRYGEVETWMGICHGWAPATIVEKRVNKAVVVPVPERNINLTFYPSDIKALFSLLWANARYDQRFIGGRCNDQDPDEDENGRSTSAECFDSNPGAWHLAVVNAMGVHGRSFVFDATYDYQVWNQPLVSYKYIYFNPLTQEENIAFEKGKVALERLVNDPYKKYRSPKTKNIIGVEMSIEYAVETSPVAVLIEDQAYDQTVSVVYRYDLELDEFDRIIGGEWHQSAHPDFIWTPTLNTVAESPYDAYLNNVWSLGLPVNESFKKAAKASSVRGIPLRKIIGKILEQSVQ